MINCNVNQIEVLKGEDLRSLLFNELMCYVLVGGNPSGTGGNVFLFLLRNTDLIIKRGNIYCGWLTDRDVYSFIPETTGFWADVDNRPQKHAEGWTGLSYVLNHYVYVRNCLARDVQNYWKTNDGKNVYDKLILSIYDACKKNERSLIKPEPYFETLKSDSHSSLSPLCEIVKKYTEIWEDPKRMKAVLLDYYPQEKLMRNLLMTSVEEGIPQELLRKRICNEADLYRYAKLIVAAHGCSIDKAKEIIWLWIDALEIQAEDSQANSRKEYPGRVKCEQLRSIRRRIAKCNDIEYESVECKHEGPCLGSCPTCEAEIEYLERELKKRQDQGYEIVLRGISEDEIKNAHITFSETKRESPTQGASSLQKEKEMGMAIDELELSVRAYNCLKRAGINSVAELTSMKYEDLMKVRNMGRKSLEEVLTSLKKCGLSFGDILEKHVSESEENE